MLWRIFYIVYCIIKKNYALFIYVLCIIKKKEKRLSD